VPQLWPPRQSDYDRFFDEQIPIIEEELALIIDLPTIPRDLRAELIARLTALKALAARNTPSAGS
jgi:hypothetical protein